MVLVVVGDGMFRNSIEISRDTSASSRPRNARPRSQSLHSSVDHWEPNPVRAKEGRKVDAERP